MSETPSQGRQLLKNFEAAGREDKREPQRNRKLESCKEVPVAGEHSDRSVRTKWPGASFRNQLAGVPSISKRSSTRLGELNSGTQSPFADSPRRGTSGSKGRGPREPGSPGESRCPGVRLTPLPRRAGLGPRSRHEGVALAVFCKCRARPGGHLRERPVSPGSRRRNGSRCRGSCSRHALLGEDFKPSAATTSPPPAPSGLSNRRWPTYHWPGRAKACFDWPPRPPAPL